MPAKTGGTQMSDVSERLTRVTARELRVPESSITAASTFVEDLGADSLALTRLAMALESEFGCTILDSEAAIVTTVDGMVKYIEGRLAA